MAREKSDLRGGNEVDAMLSGMVLFGLLGIGGVYAYLGTQHLGTQLGLWGQPWLNKDGLEISRNNNREYALTRVVNNPTDKSTVALYRLQQQGEKLVLITGFNEEEVLEGRNYLDKICEVRTWDENLAVVKDINCLQP